MKEQFVFLKYDKTYLISNLGRIFSLRTFRFVKFNFNSSGYPRVDLRINGKRVIKFIHILVVEHFGDKNSNRYEDFNTPMDVDHINKNRSDCSQKNLELVSHKENCRRRSKKL